MEEKGVKKPAGKFRLAQQKNVVYRVQVTASKLVILFGNAENSQEDLRAVYDAGRQYRKWVVAPEGYKAPWQP